MDYNFLIHRSGSSFSSKSLCDTCLAITSALVYHRADHVSLDGGYAKSSLNRANNFPGSWKTEKLLS